MGLGARARRGMTSLDELLGDYAPRVAWITSREVAIDVDSVVDVFQHFHPVPKAALICDNRHLAVGKVVSILSNPTSQMPKPMTY